MELDEQTTNLIREYVYVNVLTDGLKNDALPFLRESNITLKDLLIMMTKGIGRHYRERLKEVGAELRKVGIALWVEDQGEVVYAHVNQRGAKEVFSVKRKIVQEEIDRMIEKFMKEKEKLLPTTYTLPKVQREG